MSISIVAIVAVVQVGPDKAGMVAVPVAADMLGNLDIVVVVLQLDIAGNQGTPEPELVHTDYTLEAFQEHMQAVEDN